MGSRPAVARETFVASRASDYLTRRGLVSWVEVAVPWPEQHDAPGFDPLSWACGYALVNPHASITVTADSASSRDGAPSVVSYKASVDQSWRKPLTSDPTSP